MKPIGKLTLEQTEEVVKLAEDRKVLRAEVAIITAKLAKSSEEILEYIKLSGLQSNDFAYLVFHEMDKSHD